jgi:ribosomal-protein-alanine N-acetyltransferase
MHYAIRPMQLADLPTIMEIEISAYPFPWSLGNFRDCLGAGYRCRVLEIDGVVQGYSLASMGAGEAHILNLCVHPSLRGKGYGRLLLEEQINALPEFNVDMVLLEVRPSNTSAIALYDSMGFNELGRRKGYYPAVNGREDALIMARQIFS